MSNGASNGAGNGAGKFTKLGNLVGDRFTVGAVGPYSWQKWDPTAKRMLRSDSWKEGYSRKYPVKTDKGRLDLGVGQIGNMLAGVLRDGVADLNGRTFSVESNGKSGLDVRYYLTPVRENTPQTPSDARDGAKTPGVASGDTGSIPF